MQLKDFPYRTTKDLAEYSDLVNGVIKAFSRYSSFGIINEDLDYNIPCGEDRLEYWDNGSMDICYGRYLQLINTKKEIIKFWFGLHSKSPSANFIIWFKKADIRMYVEKLSVNFKLEHDGSLAVAEEVWISMENKDFEGFCSVKSTYEKQKEIIINFWCAILEVLNK